jgi:hypothetical protein
MSIVRLPTPGGDDGEWGDILNEFLNVSHQSNGLLKTGAVNGAGAEMTTRKASPNGYASLDSNGLVPRGQLPVLKDYAGYYAYDNQVAVDQVGATVNWTYISVDETSSLLLDTDAPDSIGVLETGVYAMTASVHWDDPLTSGSRRINLTTSCAFSVSDSRGVTNDALTNTIQSVSATFYLQAGQSIRTYVSQMSGQDLGFTGSLLITRCA